MWLKKGATTSTGPKTGSDRAEERRYDQYWTKDRK
jgi:hypothetical protein